LEEIHFSKTENGNFNFEILTSTLKSYSSRSPSAESCPKIPNSEPSAILKPKIGTTIHLNLGIQTIEPVYFEVYVQTDPVTIVSDSENSSPSQKKSNGKFSHKRSVNGARKSTFPKKMKYDSSNEEAFNSGLRKQSDENKFR